MTGKNGLVEKIFGKQESFAYCCRRAIAHDFLPASVPFNLQHSNAIS